MLKIKTTDGVKCIDVLSAGSSFSDLKVAIGNVMNIDPRCIRILRGYPPKKLSILDESTSLAELSICHGDCLQMEEETIPNAPKESGHKKPVVDFKDFESNNIEVF